MELRRTTRSLDKLKTVIGQNLTLFLNNTPFLCTIVQAQIEQPVLRQGVNFFSAEYT